jgi:anti-sigma factor RsiW
MRCDAVRDLLIEYLEGDLGHAEWEEIERHLAECIECAREKESLKQVMGLLRDDGYVEPSSFYWTRFTARLMQRVHRESPVRRLISSHGSVPKLASVATALVLFAVGFWVGKGPGLGVRGSGDLEIAGASTSTSVISSASKLRVVSGSEPVVFADYADTLRPDSFSSPTDGPQLILAKSLEPQARVDRMLSEKQIRD